MKTALFGSILLAALCASLSARSDDSGEPIVLVCGSSLPGYISLPVGFQATLGYYDTREEAVEAIQSEEGMQAIGDQLAAAALEGVICDTCVYTEDGLCPGKVDILGWDGNEVRAKVSFDAASGKWRAYAELAAEISFNLTCNPCVPAGAGGAQDAD